MPVPLMTAMRGLAILGAMIPATASAQSTAAVPDANSQYQVQQQQYQQQLQQNRREQRDYMSQRQTYQDGRARYDDQTAAYDALRARYAAERAAYHRYPWPSRYSEWRLKSDGSLVNVRVHLLNGNAVGNVVGIARSPDGVIEAVQVLLDDRSIVWLDAADVRLDEINGTIITDLRPSDIREMARERIG